MRSGFTLIAAIFVMVVFLLLGVTMGTILSGDILSGGAGIRSSQAFGIAEFGIKYTIAALLHNDYDWNNNNWIEAAPDNRFFLASNSSPETWTPSPWNSNYNRVQRNIEGGQNFDVFLNAPANLPENPAGNTIQSINIDCGGYSGKEGKMIRQTVERNLIDTFRYTLFAYDAIEITGDLTAPWGTYPINLEGMLVTQVVPSWIGVRGETTGNFTLNYGLGVFRRVAPDYDQYKALALKDGLDHDLSSSPGSFTPGIYNGNYYSDNDIVFDCTAGDVTINGSIVTRGSIGIFGSAGYVLTINPQGNYPALVSGNEIGIGANININGLIYAHSRVYTQMVPFPSNMTIKGGIFCNWNISILSSWAFYGSSINIRYDPKLRFTPWFRLVDEYNNPTSIYNNTITPRQWEDRGLPGG